MLAYRHPITTPHFLTGQARAFGPNGEASAIDKQIERKPLLLTTLGFSGDEQGDPRYHGGPDKALHHYASDHYPAWRAQLPAQQAKRCIPGAFGENLSTTGLTESMLCVGDIFSLGNTVVQVTQARQPCWKLNLRFNQPDMARQVQASAKTGWYYRVLEPGLVTPGDALRILERPHADWTLARLLHYLYAEPLNRQALTAIAELSALTLSWRQLAQRRLQTGQLEDWTRRLATPAVSATNQPPRLD